MSLGTMIFMKYLYYAFSDRSLRVEIEGDAFSSGFCKSATGNFCTTGQANNGTISIIETLNCMKIIDK